MRIKSILALVTTALAFTAPMLASADDQQTATTSSAYTTLSGDMSNYAFPDGQKLSLYPSISIGIPLNDGDYQLTSTSNKALDKNSTSVSWLLSLTGQGKTHVETALAKAPGHYQLVTSSASVYGLFDQNGQSAMSTGTATKNTDAPTVKEVLYTATLTAPSQQINSQKELAALKKQASDAQTNFQKQLGTLSKNQSTLIAPSNSSLSIAAKDINTNTDVKTAQSQSKTKIVNLDALKQAKKAAKIKKQEEDQKNHAKLVKILFTALGVILLLGVAYFFYRLFQNKKARP